MISISDVAVSQPTKDVKEKQEIAKIAMGQRLCTNDDSQSIHNLLQNHNYVTVAMSGVIRLRLISNISNSLN